MMKRELVWRQLCDAVLAGSAESFHQRALAHELGMSVGNVNLALAPLRAIGAVDVVGKRLVVRDVKKILLAWAANRERPVPLGLFAPGNSPEETLRVLPPGVALTSFAGYVVAFGDRPAPFSAIRGYVTPGDQATVAELGRRFAPTDDPAAATITTYEADPVMAAALPAVVSPAQLYVDLWNEADFFASDYLRALETRFNL